MNIRQSIVLVDALTLGALLGCTTRQPDNSILAGRAGPALPPVIVFRTLPLERPAAPLNEPPAAFCKLGTSCLEMDRRPFEPCLLSTKECRDKAAEPLLVGQLESLPDPAFIDTAR